MTSENSGIKPTIPMPSVPHPSPVIEPSKPVKPFKIPKQPEPKEPSKPKFLT